MVYEFVQHKSSFTVIYIENLVLQIFSLTFVYSRSCLVSIGHHTDLYNLCFYQLVCYLTLLSCCMLQVTDF